MTNAAPRVKRHREAPKGRPIRFLRPVVVLAGGADGEGSDSNASAEAVLVAAFRGFSGTVISGGTDSGIAGVTGAIAASHRGVMAIGYLPGRLPAGTRRDSRYSRFRTTRASTFSEAECIAYWGDLLGSGVDPSEVTLIGWGGGNIAAAEYRIAISLGARVGIVVGTGRSADALARDPAWVAAPNLKFLRKSPGSVRTFLQG